MAIDLFKTEQEKKLVKVQSFADEETEKREAEKERIIVRRRRSRPSRLVPSTPTPSIPVETPKVETPTVQKEKRVSVLTPDKQAEIMSLDSRVQTFNNMVADQRRYSPVDRDDRRDRQIDKAREQIIARLETDDMVVKKEKGKIYVQPEAFDLLSVRGVSSIDKGEIEILPMRSTVSEDMLKAGVKAEQTRELKRQKDILESRKREAEKIAVDYSEILRRQELKSDVRTPTPEAVALTGMGVTGKGFTSLKTEKYAKGLLTEKEITKDIDRFGELQKLIPAKAVSIKKTEQFAKRKELKEDKFFRGKEASKIYATALQETAGTGIKGKAKRVIREIPALRTLTMGEPFVQSIRSQLSLEYGLEGEELVKATRKVGYDVAYRDFAEGVTDIGVGATAELVGVGTFKRLGQAGKLGSKLFLKTGIGKTAAAKGLGAISAKLGKTTVGKVAGKVGTFTGKFTVGAVGVAPAGALEGVGVSAASQYFQEGVDIKDIDTARLKRAGKLGAISAGVVSGGLYATAGTKFGKVLDVSSDIIDPYEPVSDVYATLFTGAGKKLSKGIKSRVQTFTFGAKPVVSAKAVSKPTTKDTTYNLLGKVRVKATVGLPATTKPFSQPKAKPVVAPKFKPLVSPKPFTTPKAKVDLFAKVKTVTKPTAFVKPYVSPKAKVPTHTRVRDTLLPVVGSGLFKGGFPKSRFKFGTRTRGKVKVRKIADLFKQSFGGNNNKRFDLLG